MAELDLQRQMEEAAAERGSIAKALLGIQKTLDQIAPAVAKMEPALASLEPVVHDLEAWRPGVDAAVGHLQAELGDIRAQLEKIALGSAASSKAAEAPSTQQTDASRLNSGVSGDGHGPGGHCWETHPQASASEGSLLMTPVPANGTFRTPFPSVPIPPPASFEPGSSQGFGGWRNTNKHVECPEFDGDNPTGWRLRCEAYFRVCGVDPQVWVDTAIVHFTGAAALWLEWSKIHLRCTEWEGFCTAVLEKFGRAEFQLLLRKFSRLK